MTWLRQLIRWLHNLILQYKLKRLQRQANIVPLKDAASVAILFTAVNQEVIQQVSTFVKRLTEQGKEVDVLAYVPLYQETPFVRFDALTKRDINFLQIPKRSNIGRYIDQRYDLMINLSLEECLPLEYIVALSPSTYKVGRYQEDKTHCYDLMLNTDDQTDISDFIKQSEHYLNLFSHEARAI